MIQKKSLQTLMGIRDLIQDVLQIRRGSYKRKKKNIDIDTDNVSHSQCRGEGAVFQIFCQRVVIFVFFLHF